MDSSFPGEPVRSSLWAAFAASSCAFKAASLRCSAWNGVSPGRTRPEGRIGANDGRDTGASGWGVMGVSAVAVVIARVVAEALADGTAAVLAFRRLGGRRPNSCWSHRRMVSRPILMPISPRPVASVSAESPAWASRSNSSRCGSNCAVAWLRGCRAWATAWVSVAGRGVVGEEWLGSDMVVNGALYAWWLGSATGAPEAHSKRKRLDVGVLPYCFVLFLSGESGYLWGSFINWFIRLVDFLDFGLGILVELVSLRFWFHRLSVHFSGRVILGSYVLSLVYGGGGC